MRTDSFVAVVSCLLASAAPAYAGTVIDFAIDADNADFTVPTTSNVVSRQYSGTGTIGFAGNPQLALANLSDVTSFALDVDWTATLNDGSTLVDHFTYGLADLDWLYANFAKDGLPATLDFATTPVDASSGSSSGIVQKPLSVQVAFDASKGQASTAFWIYPSGLQTLSAVGSISGTTSGLPTAAPEPAAWAMMIVGFGAIGSLMRRRQRVAVSYA